MGLNIKNLGLEARIRELAQQDGMGLTEALDRLVSAELRGREAAVVRARAERLRAIEAIMAEGAAIDDADRRISTELFQDLYDERGLPI